jgi:transposase
MLFAFEAYQRAKAVRYFFFGWKPELIFHELRCYERTISKMRVNLWMYNALTKPSRRTIGCPRKLTLHDEDLFFFFLARYPTSTLPEMSWFIWEERGIMVNESTIFRALKRKKWSKKKARREVYLANPQARRDYIAVTAGLRAENMVFLDESLFNEITG